MEQSLDPVSKPIICPLSLQQLVIVLPPGTFGPTNDNTLRLLVVAEMSGYPTLIHALLCPCVGGTNTNYADYPYEKARVVIHDLYGSNRF